MIDVSVLVPVFNSKDFLCKCLDSLIDQSFENYEVILIDDGSNDGSSQICDAYAIKNPKFKVYHQENKGISSTRESAIQHANGEYILFVDSDDWIEQEALETIVGKAKQNGSDIVSFNFRVIYDNKIETLYTTAENIYAFQRLLISSYWTVLWKHLIRKSLFNKGNIHFPEGIDSGEDYYVMSLLALESTRVDFSDNVLYNYNRKNSMSVMNSVNLKKIKYQIDASKMLEKKLQSANLDKKFKKELMRRKFYSKLPLLKKEKIMWFRTFPETNFIVNWCPRNQLFESLKSCLRVLLK